MDEATATELKQRAHKTWAAGNFDDIAKLILPVGRALVERMDVAGRRAGTRHRRRHR